ncbi:MAG TPA: type II toxin-antitoxin system prevent-host-death family antitoxin [Steroidobacteraceae bacterium]|nr:type II toxin-antitoxin system prevent-host-death family antitoxin [Steroidobacteraceae bacterium]
MASIYNIHFAKTHLSRIVENAAAGEQIVLAKRGKPIARLTTIEPRVTKKQFGVLAGRFRIPDRFNSAVTAEIARRFDAT